MNRTAVDSSAIKSVGYDPTAQVLEVEFTQGRIYQYQQVEAAAFEALMRAESVGQHFNREVKTKYAYAEVK